MKWKKRKEGTHKVMLQWFRKLIEFRRSDAVLHNFNKNDIRATAIDQSGLVLHSQSGEGTKHLLCLFNFSDDPFRYIFPGFSKAWLKVLDLKEQPYTAEQSKQQNLLAEKVKANDKLIIPPLSVSVYKTVGEG